jgi:glycerol-3-phosphate acyltransferase PlsY
LDNYLYIAPIIAYFYGSVPFGFLMARVITGKDIRDVGSGNIGATNAARALGFRFFPLVFLLDFSKGFVPPLLVSMLTESSSYTPSFLTVLTALFAILGHVFPIYLKFKGGKGVATGTGACIVLAPWSVAIAALVWGLIFYIWRYVSLASICAAVALLVTVWIPLVYPDFLTHGIYRTVFASAAGLFVIYLHHENIHRLLTGRENKIAPRN